ncbi:MAG: patatin-like phospholipase family protein, partial [Sneathiella sp.]|nr:patatin-like phospholipase family protein [Sneathiella sp.]
YGVMETLRGTRINWQGEEKSLLDEVDIISSVSGGSFTAAYYGLFRERLFAKQNGFEEKFLYRDIESELKGLLFNPGNWARLASPNFGRIDIASEFYNQEIFDNKTFDNLASNGLPLIAINATDMSQGVPFTFDQDKFDILCSDLGRFNVARAVAASSNFPVAFTPLQINNYAGECGFEKPPWIKTAEDDRDFAINPRRNARARVEWSYSNSEERPYTHLLDGGVSDNIGLRGPLTALRSVNHPWSILNKINSGLIQKLVVIVVDAKTRPPTTIDKSASPPGTFSVLETISVVPLDNYSFDTVDLLKKEMKSWQTARRSLWKNPQTTFTSCPSKPDNRKASFLKPLDIYSIYVGFDQITNAEQPFGHDREWYLSLPTTFALPDKTVDKLRDVGKYLLDTSTPFNALKSCLNKSR